MDSIRQNKFYGEFQKILPLLDENKTKMWSEVPVIVEKIKGGDKESETGFAKLTSEGNIFALKALHQLIEEKNIFAKELFQKLLSEKNIYADDLKKYIEGSTD